MSGFSHLTDNELTNLLKEGNSYAYTEIFERYSEVLLRHAYRFLSVHDEANDVVQDVFLLLWVKKEDIVFQTSLSAYLYASVRNRIFDMISHQKVVSRYIESVSNFMDQDYSVTDYQVREKMLAVLIEKEIQALPEKMRQIFLLSRKEELSYKEIAEQLNITDQTARQQVYNAVRKLKLKISSLLSIIPFV
ncbi:RNA polymerase sigma 70 [Pedobacter lusitanus]|uniref:RNA polymerase sigma 70 n=1 Tax=Pedobacter lusitanus TaxID=1503925 RepID=A0A0D0GQ49_9SPHI|nr:RNA polymerase sigma-70 factor [Pedobacter lusitanus]KIO78290.1 RNA polymerase sigma 70 [Pedobacter lusitanus]